MTRLTAALRRYPHTEALLDGAVEIPGCQLEFPEVEPINHAFAPMVREQRYDISELAIATLLQAFEAGVPVAAIPVVLHGNFHHRSIWVWGGEGQLRPADLVGKRVGVRAYSQTTGLWVRGVLSDTYGVRAQDVTWVTTEGPHVAGVVEPPFVVRTDRRLVDALRAGDVDAVVMGTRSADHVDGLVPVITDWQTQQKAFLDEHGWVPINHLAVVRRDVLVSQPDLVRALYKGFAQSIDAARPSQPTGSTRELVVDYGVTDRLVATVETAIRYAREQEVITSDIRPADLFADFERYVGAT
ncbi:hypothetical protein [Nocardioides sp. KR10-350]|uniref:hypothetical protein n=1 Tax=Nocardioides cheoyonin TaxID=3156615 RepID=UPI0032B59C66